MYDEKVNLYVLLWRKVPSGAVIRTFTVSVLVVS